jgi:tripartite-type tricarboxylate transporter receptor subunit TctC
MGGEVQLTFIPPSVVRPHLNSGRLVGIAVTSATRSKLFPDLPTINESGVNGFDVVAWYGLLVPAGAPQGTIVWLNREFNKALATTAVRQSFEAAGVEAKGSTPDEFSKYIRSELAKWAKIVKVSGVRLD